MTSETLASEYPTRSGSPIREGSFILAAAVSARASGVSSRCGTVAPGRLMRGFTGRVRRRDERWPTATSAGASWRRSAGAVPGNRAGRGCGREDHGPAPRRAPRLHLRRRRRSPDPQADVGQRRVPRPRALPRQGAAAGARSPGPAAARPPGRDGDRPGLDRRPGDRPTRASTSIHGQVVLDGLVEVGSGTVIGPWVTIGLRAGNVQGPKVGRNVSIGTGAKLIGPIEVGARREDRRQRRGRRRRRARRHGRRRAGAAGGRATRLRRSGPARPPSRPASCAIRSPSSSRRSASGASEALRGLPARRSNRRGGPALTMVHNEAVFLPIWLEYYRRFFEPEDIYVLDNDSTDGSTDGDGFVRIPVDHDRVDHDWRVETIAAKQRELLDRLRRGAWSPTSTRSIAPTPAWGTLGDYLDRFDEEWVNCLGYEVLHLPDREPPLDLDSARSSRSGATGSPTTDTTRRRSPPTRWTGSRLSRPGGRTLEPRPGPAADPSAPHRLRDLQRAAHGEGAPALGRARTWRRTGRATTG